MSTELKSILGRVEVPDTKLARSNYHSGQMDIVSFSGGTQGPMIQVSISDSHLQLTRDQVKDLIKTLTDWL